MFKNTKGQFFTLAAILLIILTFVTFEIYPFLQEGKSIKTRVSTMDNFLKSIEKNLERQMYISGFRILFLAQNEITSSGNYIVNIDDFFNEAFFNGTINGVSNDILIGATYGAIIDSVDEKANKINVDLVMNNSYLIIEQSDPWNVNFSLVSNFTLTDKKELVRWDKVQVISSLIPITFFEDPIYTINSYARISRKFSITPYEGAYNIANLNDYINNNYYAANSFAPSFLNRLQGNLNADVNGVESFVKISEFSAQGLTTYDKSCVDYIYFDSLNNPAFHSVAGLPDWFKIDNIDNHTIKYGI